MAEHTVKAFDEDITRLRGLIAEMGGLAEVAIQEAMQALVTGNEELAAGVVERDLKLDRLESQVDELRGRYAIVIVTHSMQQAARVSQRTAFFHLGKMVEYGETSQIFTNPLKERTKDYITGRYG